MLKFILPLGLFFVWAGCSAFDSSHERRDGQENAANVLPQHDGDHGGGSGGGEGDTGNEGDTGGEDSGSGGEDSGSGGEDSREDTGGCENEPEVPQCDSVPALVAFKTYIQPSIDKSCNSCHAFAAGGLTMKVEENDAAVVAQNRINLKASAESASAEKLFLKISNQSSAGHGGGDQSDPAKGNLTLAKIEAWLAAEVNCD